MPDYSKQIGSHLSHLIHNAASCDGMWPSVVDLRTGGQLPEEHVPQRMYRLIGAPGGSTLYWDQPMIVAAKALAAVSGNGEYAAAADSYIDSFLERCISQSGMFRWGNHAYYSTERHEVVEFHNGYHELRPLTPAWEFFWQRDQQSVQQYLRLMGDGHVYDWETGGFNRHDDSQKGHAFLEAGGILVESLSWLFSRTGEQDLLERALKIAQYSYSHRDSSTGLVPNEPDGGRWDSQVCTSETGVWAQSLLRAAAYTAADEFEEMAAAAVEAYLKHAWDDASGNYCGQVSVATGEKVVPEEIGYWPREYANPWNTDQWPTHDYPMALAEACLSLYMKTGSEVFKQGVCRLAHLATKSPGRRGGWAYAESYGRCIHLLKRAGLALNDSELSAEAERLAEEAVGCLYSGEMFQGYQGSNVYESVDGVGYLFLALLMLQTDREPEMSGFGF